MELFFGEGVIHDALGGRVDPDIGDCIEPAPELTVEIIEIAGARAMRGDVGNMPTLPGVFPDYFAPIVRNSAEGRELVMARWGMPNAIIAPIYPKAMPVILTTPAEFHRWLEADTIEALTLLWPLSDGI
jgi:putative SOS response-associated peptidase YedK